MATVEREIGANVALASARMRARKGALERNERIQREIRALGEQRDMETKVLERARTEARERRERRERRAMGL